MKPPSCFLLAALASALCLPIAQAETSRADLLKLPSAVTFTPVRIAEWQPLVTRFGDKVMLDWERGLYEGAQGRHDAARKWLRQAAVKGNTPPTDALCLAYKLAAGTEPDNPDDMFAERKRADAGQQQIIDWYRSAASKRVKKQKLTPEEQAAYAGIESLPEGDEGDTVAHRRLVLCRNLKTAPRPEKLFRAALTAGAPLPAYAFNYLGGSAEERGQLDEAATLYIRAALAGFAPAKTNLVRLQERRTMPAPGDRAWEPILVGYRQQAEQGDGSAMIFQADLMERGLSGPQNTEIAIALYQAGIDAGKQHPAMNESMSYVLMVLHAQERLTEHYRAGRFKLSTDAERKQYLSMAFLLGEWAEQMKNNPR